MQSLKIICSLFFILLFVDVGYGQILNVESLRRVTDTSGFSGSASVDFSLKREKNQYVELSSNTHLQYKMKRHLVLWKNEVNLKSIEGDRFQNSGVTHLRYNYKFHPQIAWEVFTQAQYNKVAKINFRGLVGTGPRFKLTTSEDFKIYFGTHVMYEQEELDDDTTPIQRDLRSSSYLSMSLRPLPSLSIISTTYYQPKYRNFNDYRIASETTFLFNVIKNLSFKTSYTFIFDNIPAVGIPSSQYELKSGLVYFFG